MMNAWKKFRRTLSAFRIAQAGNVAITFAFASLPIMGFVGAAVDYSRANSVKAAMQTALDSTALMLAKEAATDTEDELKTNATKYFKALFTRPEAKDVDVLVSYSTTGGSNVVIQATAALDAEFVRVLGYDTFHLRSYVHRQVGYHPAARCVGARQHRFDVGRRQDGGPQNRNQEFDRSTARRRHDGWRRLCLDHSVFKRRQPGQVELCLGLDLLGHRDRYTGPGSHHG
jgi:Flp pilus assembly protein TadG